MTEKRFDIDADGNARVNAIDTLNAGTVNFGDRITTQQRVSVIGLDPIPPEHKPQEWIERSQPQQELLRRIQAQAKLIELVAVGGFGKSLLASWLFHKIKGEFERSLWLNFRKVPTFNEFARWVLQEIGFLIDDPRVTDEQLIIQLTYRLTEKRCLLVLDQLEAVQTANDRASFELFLQTWRERGRSSVVVMTTRSSFGMDAIAQLPLLGLTDAEGAEFLARQGIRAIAEQGFERWTRLAGGHPLLLGLAASWVRQAAQDCLGERDLEFFERLFCHYQGDSEGKVEEIFAVLFAELPERLRSLLLGVVVYRDAFGLEMAQAMLADAGVEDLQTLSDRAFLRQESERWTLHPLMRNLVEQALKESDRYQESHQKAIAYFTSKIKPEKSTIADCAEELEIFHHRCELREYALADQVMDTCVNFLERRGYYRDLLPIYDRLTQAWTDTNPDDVEEQRNLGWAWTLLGRLYHDVEQYQAAIKAHEKAQALFDRINFSGGKAASLNNFGNAYDGLGQYQRAIDFHQQSLEVKRDIGDRRGEAASLNNLGSVYDGLGQYQQAIDFHQQSLEIKRDIGDRDGEADSLNNLGSVYSGLGQYQRAIDFYQQSLEIKRDIGARIGEARSLFNKAQALAKCEPRRFEALATLEEAREIYTELQLDHMAKQCDEAIRNFNYIIATEQRQSAPILPTTPTIGNAPPRDDWYERNLPKPQTRPASQRQINWVLWFCVGVAIVLLIAWLRK
ncbi:tetratricopeptide repeat protein [Phormidesmis sp. 146-12]